MPQIPASASLLTAFEEHYDDLIAYLRRHLRDSGHARDVAHDVCVELLERPPAQPIHTPLAYLRKVFRHRAIDHLRSNAVYQGIIVSVEELPDQTHDEDGARSLDFKQQVAALVVIVDALPPRARQCFLLNRIYGMTHDAIAAEIGITRSAVTQAVRHAVKRILNDWEPARGLRFETYFRHG
ncbi:sigma-70 family RNA polymerase sigma factor [Thauera sp. SDU_THAU2]|uniref:sigma-70 family RNA polymerase sigma factor n=1 Tax=Thauera sp. SDU_THAU2 TaxID=3136633 RepID=UPI00311F017A